MDEKQNPVGLSVLLTLSLCICTKAQDTNGTLIGTVVDATQAVVGTAAITALNVDTQAKTTGKTIGDGAFSHRVPSGNYDVTVEAPRFKIFRAAAVHVRVNENSRVDATLGIGELARRPVTERCARTTLIIFTSPSFDQALRLFEVHEPMGIQTLSPEGFYERIAGWLAGA
jgi:hypothetical protein